MARLNKRSAPPKKEIEELYKQTGSTISSLARHYETSNPTVRKWLIDYDIDRKGHKQSSIEANNRHREKSKPSKKELEALYEDATIESLQRYFSVGQETIYAWLDEYNIPLRSLSESTTKGKKRQYKDIQFSFDILDKEYDRSKSIDCLAEKLNVSRSHIRSQLNKNGITIEPIEPAYRSKAEIELYDFLMDNFPDDKWCNSDRTIINPYELDIVNKDKKVAIEYCGVYWHSELSSGRGNSYHKHKYNACKDMGYKLITVFETDDTDKVKSLLLKILGKTQKIGARKTKIQKLDSKTAMKFHKEHHLHSSVGSKYHYGLVYDNTITMVASFGKNRFGSKQEYECSRITSHSSITVVGGVSKLIKHFIKTEEPESIITFADLRFGDGSVYEKCGFTYIEDTSPNYWYTYRYKAPLYSRVKFQKHKLSELLGDFDPLKTEFENMVDNRWDRIWDCGNAKYTWTRS